MKILMISIDKGLLGKGQLGDVIQRHQEYGKHVESLDIIVQCKSGFQEYQLSGNVRSYPTNSKSKFLYVRDSFKIGKKLYGQKKYDLIVTQDPFLTGSAGLKLKKQFGSKLLVHMHGDFIDNLEWLKESWVNRVLLPLGKKIIKSADAVRVMSEGQKEKLLGLNRNVNVVSTPVDTSRFGEDSSQKIKYPWSRSVLMVGREDKVKDFPTLFSAMKNVFEQSGDVGLVLVGNYKNEEEIPLSSERVRVFPAVDTNDLPNYYRAASVVVLSSTSESFGKVLVEANASGKPVVSTDTTGAREIIQEGVNGFIVPKSNPLALAEKIIYLLNHPTKAQAMGDRGREIMLERFDGSKNIQKIIQLWGDVIAKNL